MTTPTALTHGEFKSLAGLVYEKTGISLADSKKPLLSSRLQKRLRANGLESFGAYYDFVVSNDDEVEQLINAITTNKTDFFREAVQFKYLKETLLPALVSQRRYRLRLWSAAASTGEEAWTMAMALYDALPEPDRWDVRILGTDIDTDVLAKGRSGLYSLERVRGIEPHVLARHFEPTDEGYSVRPHLRKWVDFRRMNLIAPKWPHNQVFDAVFCRNVIIYFDQQTKDRLIRRFAQHVAPDGRLFVGLSEAVHWMPDVWKAVGPSVYVHADAIDAQAHAKLRAEIPPTPPPVRAPRKFRSSHPGANLPAVRIIVGQVEARSEPSVISTLLGSCVGVALYDPVRKIGGMNHFLLPSKQELSEVRVASHGAYAMELLVNAVLKLGAQRRDLRAKIFGGGRVLQGMGTDIGAANLKFAHMFLEQDSIPIVAVRAGGEGGLDVSFMTATGQAFVRPIVVAPWTSVEKINRRHLERVLSRDKQDRAELF